MLIVLLLSYYLDVYLVVEGYQVDHILHLVKRQHVKQTIHAITRKCMRGL